MTFDFLRYQVEDGIATITIDKPPVNAMDSDMYGELYEILYKLSRDKEVRCAILTATGEKIFVGGSDVREFTALDKDTGPLYTTRNNGVRTYLYNFPKPIICALNGSALGGGLGLAMLCDIRISPPEAKFSLGEINMGIIGLTHHIIARVPNGTARKMVYTGQNITAEEALRIGLIDEIVPKEEVLPRALELAKVIASKSPLAIKLAKESMLEAEKILLQNLAFEEERVRYLWSTEDKNEAVNAFLEKREAHFEGK